MPAPPGPAAHQEIAMAVTAPRSSPAPQLLPCVDPALNPLLSAWQYGVDAWQRGVLYTDVMRQRGNQYRKHIAKKAPHVLSMDSEVVLNGHTFERPVNYSLLR